MSDDHPLVFGHTIFCDDIRHEVGNKTSLIGVYNGVITIHGTFPATLPKFGFAITYYEIREKVTDPVTLRVFSPGDTLENPTFSVDLPIDEVRKQAIADVTQAPADFGLPVLPLLRVDTGFVLSPYVIREKGAIRVRAFVGDKIIRLGTLRIEQQLPPTPPAELPPPAPKTPSSS